MVAPLTGPLERIVRTRDIYDLRIGWRQTRPYNLPLAYKRQTAIVSRNVSDFGPDADAIAGWEVGVLVDTTAQVSMTYERLKNLVTSRAELAVNLIEIDRSVRMIQTRLVQMGRFLRMLRRGNVKAAARELALPSAPKRASPEKTLANNFLEYHFGWSPLISDIYNAVDHLQNPLKDVAVRARTKSTATLELDNSVSENYWDIGFFVVRNHTQRRYVGEVSVSMGTKLRIDNPNLFLANSLGLVNPATIVWEVIPFSFVVDWFVNVQQFLSQGTDWLGLTLVDAWTTSAYKGMYRMEHKCDRWWEEPSGTYPDVYMARYDASFWRTARAPFVTMQRSTGIQGPDLHVRPFKLWHWKRAASAASLLVQQFGRR